MEIQTRQPSTRGQAETCTGDVWYDVITPASDYPRMRVEGHAVRTGCTHGLGVASGPAPARAYIPDLLPDVLEGRIEPGRVFDRVASLDEVPDGYRAMNDREVIKVLIEL